MLYPEGIPQTDIVPCLEETLGLDAAEEVVKADRLIENSPFDPGVGHVHGLPDFSEVTGRRRYCPGSKFWPRDRPRPGDKSRCRGGICRKSLVGNRKSSPCKQRKNHRQDNNPRSLQWSKSNGMHFSARKIIDAYLSRNHVVFHKFSFVCVSTTLIKFK